MAISTSALASMSSGCAVEVEFDLLPILLNPQVEESLRSHRHHKTDVERAPRGSEICGELAHGAESTRNRNCNGRALPGQHSPFSGGRLQAGSESSFLIDCGLSILGLFLGSVNI